MLFDQDFKFIAQKEIDITHQTALKGTWWIKHLKYLLIFWIKACVCPSL